MGWPKFQVGEQVEMLCDHLHADGQRVTSWQPGQVTAVDERMVAVQFNVQVFANPGWPVADRTLWCTHGSRRLRRLDETD